MERMNFIRTTDEDTANKLRDLGFYEVQSPGISGYVFVNNYKSLNFNKTEIDLSQLKYTNRLCV